MSLFQRLKPRFDPPAGKRQALGKLYQQALSLPFLILAVALFLLVTANVSFFEQVLAIYPFSSNAGFIISITGLLFGLIWLLIQLFCYQSVAKAVLIAMLIIAAVCGYFTDTYGTVFDRNMMINTLQTDRAEAMGLLTPGFFLRVMLLGILPACVIYKFRIKKEPWRRALIQRSVHLLATLILIGVCLGTFGDQYASFFRQHKIVRSYTNPLTPIYAVIKLGLDYTDKLQQPKSLILHASDAKSIKTVTAKPKLMVFVVGETVRSDHIGLNGYSRNTTPLLANQPNIFSFQNALSCGTSTAYSVPCMFSYANKDDYDMDTADYHENVLDTLNKQGVNVIWRDNNSSSKGVADRVTFEDFKSPKVNPNCDEECRDVGMLKGFDRLIKTDSAPKDTLILLHQMGNHGPAYFKRYPKAFEAYKPVCMTNELSKCDNPSIINGYDNAIRYTDYFLNEVIKTLKPYEDKYDVMMIYASDHGESLGENNIYLHGLPYSIAPMAQKHIPMIVWSPPGNGVDNQMISQMIDKPVSHDFITPTLLRYFDITSAEVKGAPTLFDPALLKVSP